MLMEKCLAIDLSHLFPPTNGIKAHAVMAEGHFRTEQLDQIVKIADEWKKAKEMKEVGFWLERTHGGGMIKGPLGDLLTHLRRQIPPPYGLGHFLLNRVKFDWTAVPGLKSYTGERHLLEAHFIKMENDYK
jgi:hypothetical protein